MPERQVTLKTGALISEAIKKDGATLCVPADHSKSDVTGAFDWHGGTLRLDPLQRKVLGPIGYVSETVVQINCSPSQADRLTDMGLEIFSNNPQADAS